MAKRMLECPKCGARGKCDKHGLNEPGRSKESDAPLGNTGDLWRA